MKLKKVFYFRGSWCAAVSGCAGCTRWQIAKFVERQGYSRPASPFSGRGPMVYARGGREVFEDGSRINRCIVRIARPRQEQMDPYIAIAAKMFGITPSSVTTEQRRAAKSWSFGSIYGVKSKTYAEKKP